MIRTIALALSACLCAVAPALAQDDHAGHGGAGSTFGRVHFPISCTPKAQEQFDGAVAILHSFFYPETEKAFRAVAETDPSCAMAYWGVAISQRPNPLTAPFPKDLLRQGWEAIGKARAATTATPREREWIEAMAAFFQDYESVDQRTRSDRYEAAMSRLHATYADDTEGSVFYALALLEAVDLTDKSYAKQLRAATLLESLQKGQPDHPGIPHYLIHSYDYAPIAAKGLPAARRYASLAPSAPHALHMPSHTFSTLGMWREAIQANIAADAANRAYGISTNPAAATNPATIAGRYHALDFLVNAYLQLGQDALAKTIVDERNTITGLPANASITAHTGFAAIPVRHAFDRSAWAEAASLTPMESPYRQAEAISWFARAVGAARSGALPVATESLAQIVSRQKALEAAGDPYWADQVLIQQEAATAWIALASRDKVGAIAMMRAAADREDASEKHVAMENRLSPMRELLGELLLQAGEPKAALSEFQRSLEAVPNRRRSLLGAANAAERAGDGALGASFRARWTVQTSASLPLVAPETVGLSAPRLAEATSLLKQLVAEQKIAGAVAAVARHGKVAYLEAVGDQDLSTKAPMSAQSLFRIYSMTKSVTAVAAMMLFEEGRFRLDDPVARYLPEFSKVTVAGPVGGSPRPPARPITIENLLLHTSGLNHRTSPEYQVAKVRSRSIGLPQFVSNITRTPLMEDPGTKYRYSEGTTVLGRLIEIWSGQPFDAFLDARIFKPLHMADTGFVARDEQKARLTTVYAPAEGGGVRPVEIEEVPFTTRPALLEGAVGLLSTVPDYLRFSQMLLNGGTLDGARLLRQETVAMMTVNRLPEAIFAERGGVMGWGLANVNIVADPSRVPYPADRGEYGWDGTAGTIFWIDPGKEMVTILMTQSAPANPDRIRQRFKTLIEQSVVPQ